MELLVGAVLVLMVMVPLWRITRRTGRDPWLSLLVLGTPPLGTLLFLGLLAFGRWPALGAAGAGTGGRADPEAASGPSGVTAPPAPSATAGSPAGIASAGIAAPEPTAPGIAPADVPRPRPGAGA